MPNSSSSNTLVRRLTRQEVPDGTTAIVFGDSHFGEHDAPALDLMVECADRIGAKLVISNGDIANCGAVARHPDAKSSAIRKYGDLRGEVESAGEYVKWLATRGGKVLWGVGNHEDWINDVADYSGLGSALAVRTALDIPETIEVLPHGYQIRVGSLAIEHGDIIFPRGNGPRNLARTILTRFPAQTTIVNHFHREDYAVSTTPDSRGILRSHAAYALGHLSDPTAHYRYAGRNPDWQQGFGIINFWYEDDKPRFTVNQVQIHRTRRGRPIFNYSGHTYR